MITGQGITTLSIGAETTPSPMATSVKGAAQELGCSRDLIYRLIREGRITPCKLGSRTLIPRADLLALLASAKSQ
ncbi:MAG: helix-turn-helix domain-containing protein [Geminicoccaceae bacterium]